MRPRDALAALHVEVQALELRRFFGPGYRSRAEGGDYGLEVSLRHTPKGRLAPVLEALRDVHPWIPGDLDLTRAGHRELADLMRDDRVAADLVAAALDALDRSRCAAGGADGRVRGRWYGTWYDDDAGERERAATPVSRARTRAPTERPAWYETRWLEPDDARARRASNRVVLRAVLERLSARAIRGDDARWYLRHALWRETELERSRKYLATPFRTRAIANGDTARQLEHVVELRWLVERLASEPDRWLVDAELERLLALAVTCVVTRTEHQWLTKGYGWSRYLRTGIEVLDFRHTPPRQLDLDEEAARLQSRMIALEAGR